MKPIELGPNQPRQFYRGGQAIADFRGTASIDEYRPEDWIGSTSARFGLAPDGLTRLPDGRFLVDAVDAAPEDWLGPDHARYFGASTALLVKLLDAGQRLPVHVHPAREFAWRHLGTRHGKTEAWVVLGTSGADPAVYLGWSRDVEEAELARWARDQQVEQMLGNLNTLRVSPGDAVLVPAGTAHAIGEGVFVVELQEPTDFSVMLEMKGFDIDPAGGELGLGRELALSCVHKGALTPRDIDNLVVRSSRRPPTARGETMGGSASGLERAVENVFPPAAAPYFRAQRARGSGGPEAVRLEPSFAVVVGLAGRGVMRGEDWEMAIGAGSTAVVPWGAGYVDVQGEVELLRCLPPLASEAARDDPTNDE